MTDSLTCGIPQYDMCPFFIPVDVPAPVFHFHKEVISTGALRNSLYDCLRTVDHVTVPIHVREHLIFVLAPRPDLSGLNLSSVKMLSLFSHGERPIPTKIVREVLLSLKVFLRLMQLVSVHKGNRICHNVYMKVILILMDGDQVLEIGEELLTEVLTDLQTLPLSHIIIRMETDDIVGTHPSGVFVPKLLFINERLRYIFRADHIIVEGPLKRHITVLHLLVLKNISDEASHGCVCFCRVVNDLFDCHICSLSFLKSSI